MEEDVVVIPPVTPPAAPPVAPPPVEPRGHTLSEQKFFAKRDASSLPNPSVIPPQEPAPVAPPVEVVPPVAQPPVTPPVDEPIAVVPPVDPPVAPPVQAEPPIAEIAEDDFSTELPGLGVEDGSLLEAPAVHPDSPLKVGDPQWAHDAFNRLQADTTISPEDKKTIAELPPTAWDKARRWQNDTKTLGQFRDEQVPIGSVYDTLTKQSKERTDELQTEALNRLLSNPDGIEDFSAKHPQLYATVMTELINNASDVVASVLKKKGFNVVKAEPFDKQKIIDRIKANPMYETLAETDMAVLIEQEITNLAELIGEGTVTPEELAAQMAQPDVPATKAREAFAQVQTTVKEAQETQWKKAIGDGLQAAGIKPATQVELAKNPQAAHLKTVLYEMALNGLPGVVEGWDEHSAKWGANQPGFKETFEEVAMHLQRGDMAAFQESAPSLNPFYFEFGKKRSGMGLIQNLYRAVDGLLGVSVAAPPPVIPGVPPPVNGGLPPGGGELPKTKSGREMTFSEQRYFKSKNGVPASN